MTSTETQPDAERMLGTMDHIDSHPKEHNQSMWGERASCGTTFCFAGTALILAGYKPSWASEGGYKTASRFIAPDGRVVFAEDEAQEILGLARWQANRLFYCPNDRAELRRRVEGIIAGTLKK